MILAVVAAEKSLKNVAVKMHRRPVFFDFRMFLITASLLMFVMGFDIISAPNILDTKFYYSANEMQIFFKKLNIREQYRYIVNEFFDLGFIVSYTAFLFLSLRRLVFKKPKLSFISIIPATFDLTETISILAILLGALNIKNISWLGYITALKWISAGLVVAFYLLAVGFRLFKKNPN